MRILHITFSLLNAGKENQLVDLANVQAQSGIETCVLVINDLVDNGLENRINKTVKLLKLNRKNKSYNPIPWIKLWSLMQFSYKPDVIHSHDPQLGTILKLLSNKPSILTIHGPAFSTKAMRHYDKLVCVSKAVKKDVEDRSENKCDVIYNGLEFQRILQKSEWSINKNYISIIVIGRLNHHMKGQDLLIDAAQLLVQANRIRGLKIFFFGEGNSKEYLKQKIVEAKLTDTIFFKGNKDRDWIFKHLHKFDLLIQPSRMEGFGLSVVEAMLARVPVLSANIEGPGEIIKNGKYGFLFNTGDSKDLADQMEYVLNNYDQTKMMNLTEKAYTYCLSNFDIKSTAAKYIKCYRQLMTN